MGKKKEINQISLQQMLVILQHKDEKPVSFQISKCHLLSSNLCFRLGYVLLNLLVRETRENIP